MDWLKYFGDKSWALLHDPPNKMWIIVGKNGTGRCYDKTRGFNDAHEEDAAEMWYELGLSDPFGDINNSSGMYGLVKEADKLASSMDRWLISKTLGKNRGGVFSYHKLHNIFNPTLKVDLNTVNCPDVRKYITELKNILDIVNNGNELDKEKLSRIKYHVLYSMYELKWISDGLPPSLADTRMPTHSVFDHVYATAMSINMLWPNGTIGGYLVELDIPGIQRVINAARKAGDFWAGSWLVSMLAWLAVWPLVWKYGPDIIIKPTLRLNPIYHVFLVGKLNQISAEDYIKRAILDFYMKLIFKMESSGKEYSEVDKWLTRLLISRPIIPGTIQLILPRDLGSMENIENLLADNFKKAYKCLMDWAFNGSCEDKNYEEINIMLKERSPPTEFMKIASKIYGEFKDGEVFDGLINPRFNVIDLSIVYSCAKNYIEQNKIDENCYYNGITDDLLNDFKGRIEAINKTIEEITKISESSDADDRESINDNKEKEKKEDNDDYIKRAILDLGLNVLRHNSVIKSMRIMNYSKAWFKMNGNNIVKTNVKGEDPFSKYVFYGRKSTGYSYCSICGEEPAILHFRKSRNGEDYDSDTKKMIAELLNVSDGDVTANLVSQVKPGEKIGPLCLLKRTIYYRFMSSMGHDSALPFDTTDDIAIAWIASNAKELIEKIEGKDSCNQVANYLKPHNGSNNSRSITELCSPGKGNCVESAVKNFNKCMDEIDEETLINVFRRLPNFPELKNLKIEMRPNKKLIHFRSNYVIIRGDADNIGKKLSRGKIDMKSYSNLMEELANHFFNNGMKEYGNVYRSISQNIANIELLVTPAYLSSLSMALMITALTDIYITDYKYLGGSVSSMIFSGGDDVLALAPIEVALAMVKDLRKNYWGSTQGSNPGFHSVGKYHFPALTVFGRSFAARFVNIMDNMNEEIKRAAEDLEMNSKEAKWGDKDIKEKDALTISESRSNASAVVPLSDGSSLSTVGTAVDFLNKVFLFMIGNALSHNIPEDYDKYADIIRMILSKNIDDELLASIWNSLISNNIIVNNHGLKYLPSDLEVSFDSFKKSVYGILLFNRDTNGNQKKNIIDEFIKAIKILRGYP